MIVEIRINNCYIFNQEVVFSMNADMRNKRFITNVHKENNFNILKTAAIYGSNNTGKTCFVKCIADIKNTLLNRKSKIMSNLFTDNSICEFGITFLEINREFSFDFKFDGEALQRSSLAGDFDEIPENPPFFGGHETGKRVAAGTFPPGCGRI